MGNSPGTLAYGAALAPQAGAGPLIPNETRHRPKPWGGGHRRSGVSSPSELAPTSRCNQRVGLGDA